METQSVPFTVGEELGESLTVRGRVSFGGGSVTFELPTPPEVGDASVPRKVVMGVEEFAACKFRRGLLGDRLELKTASHAGFGGVPGAFQDAMTLRVSKRDRLEAEALADRLATRLSRGPAATFRA